MTDNKSSPFKIYAKPEPEIIRNRFQVNRKNMFLLIFILTEERNT